MILQEVPCGSPAGFGGSEGQLILTLLRNTKSKLADVFMA